MIVSELIREPTAHVRTWNPPCQAWIESRVGIKLSVWVHSVVGKYATVSYKRRTAKRHPVRVSDLRKPEERYSPNKATTTTTPATGEGLGGGEEE